LGVISISSVLHETETCTAASSFVGGKECRYSSILLAFFKDKDLFAANKQLPNGLRLYWEGRITLKQLQRQHPSSTFARVAKPNAKVQRSFSGTRQIFSTLQMNDPVHFITHQTRTVDQ
jgi:hypothetical protein